MSDTIQTSAAVQTRERGVRVNSSPGAPGGTHGVEADAGRGAGLDARRCTVQRGARGAERKKVLARAPCLCPSFSPPERVVAVELSVGPRPGRSGTDHQENTSNQREKSDQEDGRKLSVVCRSGQGALPPLCLPALLPSPSLPLRAPPPRSARSVVLSSPKVWCRRRVALTNLKSRSMPSFVESR